MIDIYICQLYVISSNMELNKDAKNGCKIADMESIKEQIESFMFKMTEGPTHWRCTACEKTTKVKSHMVDHVESKHVLVPTECPYCNRIFKSRGNCRSHISAIHKDEHRTLGLKLF